MCLHTGVKSTAFFDIIHHCTHLMDNCVAVAIVNEERHQNFTKKEITDEWIEPVFISVEFAVVFWGSYVVKSVSDC